MCSCVVCFFPFISCTCVDHAKSICSMLVNGSLLYCAIQEFAIETCMVDNRCRMYSVNRRLHGLIHILQAANTGNMS